jgi:Ca-activated chloride channel family protein
MTGIFDHPWVLLGFLVFIPILLSEYFSARRKRIQTNLPKDLWMQLFASRIFFALFLAFLVTALAGPRWGIGQRQGEYRRAVDAVIALDVSRSMEIRDNAGGLSRLERGLAVAREAVDALPGMRFAVTVSRSRGIVAIPLTWDNGAVLALLEAVDGSNLSGWGTNLESLVDASAGVFQSSHPSNRVIILISDGEELSGSLKAALGRCSQEAISVAAVAVGSDEGGEVPGLDGIASFRDANAMRAAASETGGIYIDGSRSDAAEALAAHLRSLAAETYAGKNKQERKAHWFTFAMLAIIAYGASRLSLLKVGRRNV